MNESVLEDYGGVLIVFDKDVSTDFLTFEHKHKCVYVSAHEGDEQTTVEVDINAVPKLIEVLQGWYDSHQTKNK